jgi:hypothetical protein
MGDEILTQNAAALIPRLARFKNFYLVGGTALALQIGHRRSIDFDLFSKEPLPLQLLSRVKKIFEDFSPVVTYRSPEQLNVSINDVKVTFLFFDYPVIDGFLEYKGLSLASVPEIAAMKAFSIGKRLFYKNYVDWYFMLKEHYVKLPDVIALAQKKFGGDFNDRLFLGQLVSLAEVPTQKIDFLRDEVDRETIVKFLEAAVKELKW